VARVKETSKEQYLQVETQRSPLDLKMWEKEQPPELSKKL
jgi:hypothetical protein